MKINVFKLTSFRSLCMSFRSEVMVFIGQWSSPSLSVSLGPHRCQQCGKTDVNQVIRLVETTLHLNRVQIKWKHHNNGHDCVKKFPLCKRFIIYTMHS